MPNKILIAEDSSFIASTYEIAFKFLEKEFEEFGLGFKIVENGKLFVVEIKKSENNYFLGFIDYDMPILDGIGTIKETRRTHSKLPLYIRCDDSSIERTASQAGANGFISIPFKREELGDIIREHYPFPLTKDLTEQ